MKNTMMTYDEISMEIMKEFNNPQSNLIEAYRRSMDLVESSKSNLTEKQYYQLYEYTEWIYQRKVSKTIFGNDSTLLPKWIPDWN